MLSEKNCDSNYEKKLSHVYMLKYQLLKESPWLKSNILGSK